MAKIGATVNQLLWDDYNTCHLRSAKAVCRRVDEKIQASLLWGAGIQFQSQASKVLADKIWADHWR